VALGFVSNINVLQPLCLSTKSARKLIGRMKLDTHVLVPTAIKGKENRLCGFSVRFPNIKWIETCLIPEMDDHKFVYTLSGCCCLKGYLCAWKQFLSS